MQARIIEKIVEVDGRRFVVRKFTAFTGVKIGKVLTAKLLPALRSILPAVSELLSILEDDSGQEDAEMAKERRVEKIKGLIGGLDGYLSLEGISKALDLVSNDDLDFIMKSALASCFEQLPGGNTPVLRADGTFGAQDVEYDPLLTLRLVYEAIRWGLGDFFTEKLWTSFMNPPSDSSPQSQPA